MLITLIQKQFVIYPKSDNNLTFLLVEDTVSLDHIVIKYSFKYFTVC